MSEPAVIYVRKSQVRKDRDLPGLERQELDCREYCERHGLTVAAVFSDQKSAWAGPLNDPKPRPGLKSAFESLGRYGAKHFILWRLDRGTRAGVLGLAELLKPLDKAGAALHSVLETIDASTPMGRGVLGILAAQAQQESQNTSTRVKRARLDEAKAGQRHGGPRMFGFKEGSNEWDPAEAALIKQAAADVIAGTTLRAIARKWDAAGLKGPRGGTWTGNAVGDILRAPRLIGQRVHGDTQHKAEWDPLIDTKTFAAVGSALREGDRNRSRTPSVLSGLLVCGRCGQKLHAGPPPKAARASRYVCKMDRIGGGCGLSISRPVADEFVISEVLRLMDAHHASGAPQVAAGEPSTLEEDREALRRLLGLYTKGKLNEDAFWTEHDRLDARINEAEKKDAALPAVTLFGTDWWKKADEKERRRVLRDVILTVAVAPVGRGACRLNPADRLKINFRFGWIMDQLDDDYQ